ncbi:MAG: adenylyl-sulfate kinase [Verrucomicrobia bacterium]|nr:MAG: adenylyl-sulfate kinase [Verrucomicrobiota bacterium]
MTPSSSLEILPTSNLRNSSIPSQTPTAAGQKLRVVIVGHVDHGKSTLIGRLFYDTHSLSAGKIEMIRKASEAEGMEFEFAFLLDALLEEQEQNITIDTTQLPFRVKNREYVIIDAPGHQEFLKNMVTGAASADAAILLVDAVEGLREQSRRHALLLAFLGIKQVIVAVNKMDLVAFQKARFEQIRCEALDFLAQIKVEPQFFIPISAKQGQNLARLSSDMPWYGGPSIVEALGDLVLPTLPAQAPLRFMIQDIYRFDHRRLLVGRIEGGSLRQGDEVYFWPNGKRSRIRSIEEWNVEQPPGAASAGESIAITLEEQIFVERGNIASHAYEIPAIHREITASLFWLHDEPLLLDKPFILKLGTQSTEARLVGISRALDSASLQLTSQQPTQIAKNEVAEVRIRTKRLLVFDPHDQMRPTGRFVILAEKRIGGGGIILRYPKNTQAHAPASAHLVWSTSRVSRTARLEQYGHRGAILWMTGLSASGKSSLASQLEWHLHRRGMAAFMLDGDNLRHGLSADLGFGPRDRKENIRRAGEAAKLLAEAGLVVICSFISPYREDRRLLRENCAREGIAFAEIYVNAPLNICEKRDPKGLYKKARAGEIPDFTGVGAPYEPPPNPELELCTSEQAWEECLALLFKFAESFAAPPHPDLPRDLDSGSGI